MEQRSGPPPLASSTACGSSAIVSGDDGARQSPAHRRPPARRARSTCLSRRDSTPPDRGRIVKANSPRSNAMSPRTRTSEPRVGDASVEDLDAVRHEIAEKRGAGVAAVLHRKVRHHEHRIVGEETRAGTSGRRRSRRPRRAAVCPRWPECPRWTSTAMRRLSARSARSGWRRVERRCRRPARDRQSRRARQPCARA